MIKRNIVCVSGLLFSIPEGSLVPSLFIARVRGWARDEEQGGRIQGTQLSGMGKQLLLVTLLS